MTSLVGSVIFAVIPLNRGYNRAFRMANGATTKTDYLELRLVSFALLGTLAGAAIFGLIQGGVIGFIVGPIFAVFIAILIVPSVIALSWSIWLIKYRASTALVAGSATGIISTLRSHDASFFQLPLVVSLVAAAAIGGCGAAISVQLFAKQQGRNREDFRFRLFDMFVRIAVLSAVLAAWVNIIEFVNDHDTEMRSRRIEVERELEELRAMD